MKIVCLLPAGTSVTLDEGLKELGEVRYVTESDSDSEAQLAVVSPIVTVDEAFLNRFPAVKMIASFGVGYERVNLDLLKARGIVMTNAASATSHDVADLAWALITGAARRISYVDRTARERLRVGLGSFLGHRVSGKRLGVAGLGHIGREIARRAEGFRMPVGYTNRSEVKDVPYRRFKTLEELAAWCDILVLAMPGGAANHHLVNRDILCALGKDGYLVNVGRGEVVDNDALIAALEDGTVAGAGLDVYDGEPAIDARFAALDNLVMVPHMGSATHEARADAGLEVLKNLRAFLETGDAPDRLA